jgi:toxin ParE1/3/4
MTTLSGVLRLSSDWPGRVAGTQEMVVRRNHVVLYAENARAVSILRVLHGAQQWPTTQE